MNYISDCCGAQPVDETLNAWDDYGGLLDGTPNDTPIVYGTCSSCQEHSLFSEGE